MPSAMAVSTNVADFALKLMRHTHMISFISLAVGSHVQQKANDRKPRRKRLKVGDSA